MLNRRQLRERGPAVRCRASLALRSALARLRYLRAALTCISECNLRIGTRACSRSGSLDHISRPRRIHSMTPESQPPLDATLHPWLRWGHYLAWWTGCSGSCWPEFCTFRLARFRSSVTTVFAGSHSAFSGGHLPGRKLWGIVGILVFVPRSGLLSGRVLAAGWRFALRIRLILPEAPEPARRRW